MDAAADAQMMQAALQKAAHDLNMPEKQEQIEQKFNCADVPMSGVSDMGANFLPNLLGHWTSARRIVTASNTGANHQASSTANLTRRSAYASIQHMLRLTPWLHDDRQMAVTAVCRATQSSALALKGMLSAIANKHS